MRINQLVSDFSALQSIATRVGSGAEATKSAGSSGQTAIPGLERAVRANQARFDEASKGFVQAGRIRDAMTTMNHGVGQALEAVKRLQSGDLTAAQRTQAHKDFTAALAQVDTGSKAQTTAVADPQLRNKVFDPSRVQTLSADRLGTKASTTFASVASLKNLDPTQASADDLAAVAKVLASAQQQTSTQLVVAQAQTDRQAGRVNQTHSTLALLGVQTDQRADAKTSTNQQILKQLQALIHQPATLPGGMFDSQA